MGEKTYYVGRDDISVSNLTIFDVDAIVMRRSVLYRSPLDFDFILMPDLSFLQLQWNNYNFGINRKICCYSSVRFSGGLPYHRKNYIVGSKIWGISAFYRPVEKSTEYADLNNVPSHIVEVYGTKRQYKMHYVVVDGPGDKLSEFSDLYFVIKESLTSTQTWIDGRFTMEASCRCGHFNEIGSEALQVLFSKGLSIEAVKSRLKCDACGKKGNVEIHPLYSENTPDRLKHKTAWVSSKGRRYNRERTIPNNPELVRMYENLGGDGRDRVYLGDGAYLSKNGEVSD
ncbi:hypothetical protein [Mesorhizobium sp. KR2-14]|uniref:hypothetical protein n=1 Tax=Mesorhizobium sp. KR2-14 TaxID=3156610 RepID=UPI0032B35C41